ncbi:MAG: hypothetical protein HYU66_14325 [Armatimonadetes bacterium]|nr:hypothetical protein [Armatimonadota bacterium]
MVAGLSFGMKSTALMLPGAAGKVIGLAQGALTEMLKGVLGADEAERAAQDKAPDDDPVAAMAKRFRELAQAALGNEGGNTPDRRLLVCIDDMDRCLPDRQIEFLEAIRFLTSTGAPAVFVVAVDPTLLTAALRSHYNSGDFDADHYLAKMFDLRVSLPGIDDGAVKALLKRQFPDDAHGHLQILADAAAKLFRTPTTRNPRCLIRMTRRIKAWANHTDGGVRDEREAMLAMAWFAIAECWPLLRRALQESGDEFVRLADDIVKLYGGPLPKDMVPELLVNAPRWGLPAREDEPALADLLGKISVLQPAADGSITGPTWALIERLLRRAGL